MTREPVDSDPPGPGHWRGVPCWTVGVGDFGARFLGRGSPPRDAALAGWLAPEVSAASWLHQCHSADVHVARPGQVGDGDALVVREAGIAAVVATADCVPVVAVGAGGAAVIHAGWRGIVAGVVARALDALGGAQRAWIGPAIGPCCYEVGDEVADAVEAASGASLRRPGRGARPHLDLTGAVAAQLAHAGVESIATIDLCTRCHPELLASYRRDGERAGRNLTLVWRVR